MTSLNLKRRDAFNVIQEENGRPAQKEHLCNFVLSSWPTEKLNDRDTQSVRNEVSRLFSKIMSKWEASSRKLETFEKKHGKWLEEIEIISVKVSETKKRGRPEVSFSDAKPRAKRAKCEDLVETYSAENLLYAASMKYRKEGNLSVAKILKLIHDDPKCASLVLEAYESSSQKKEEKVLTNSEALACLLDGNFSKMQYMLIRKKCISRAIALFPPYKCVLLEKKKCYPGGITVSQTKAEVDLQSLLDNDSLRLITLLQEIGSHFEPGKTYKFKFYHKIGADGSGDHSEYKQRFNEDGASDKSILLTAICPLQLQFENPQDPFIAEGMPKVMWTNPSPSSTKFCKPLRIQMIKESRESALAEEAYISEKISAVTPSVVTCESEALIHITHDIKITMVDGKVRGYLANTPDSNCYVCGARPVQMKASISLKRPVEVSYFKYGLPVLHVRIRLLECVLHISYKLDIKKWKANESLYADRKTRIQTQIRQELGILVDGIKRGAGSTNDGNTSSKFFKNPEIVSNITGFDLDLLKRFGVIQTALASGCPINIEAFRKYGLDTNQLYEELYPWYYMPPSLHIILIHGADIMETLELPMGAYSEEALEASNKYVRSFREFRSRKISREANLQDVFCRLLLNGDVYLSSKRSYPATSKESYPPEVQQLLL